MILLNERVVQIENIIKSFLYHITFLVYTPHCLVCSFKIGPYLWYSLPGRESTWSELAVDRLSHSLHVQKRCDGGSTIMLSQMHVVQGALGAQLVTVSDGWALLLYFFVVREFNQKTLHVGQSEKSKWIQEHFTLE
jgi:hypothetical protein